MLIAASVTIGACRPALAIDRLVLTADAITMPAGNAAGVRIALDLTPAAAPSVRIDAAAVNVAPAMVSALGSSAGRPLVSTHYTALDATCARLESSGSRIACGGAQLALHGGLLDPLSVRGAAELDTSRGAFAFDVVDLPVAGGHARFSGHIAPNQWAVHGSATTLDVGALRALAAHWVELPPGDSLTGQIDLELDAASRSGSPARTDRATHLAITARTAALGFSNPAGTVASEKLAATLSLVADLTAGGTGLRVDASGSGGQVLVGPVLADFQAHPLDLHASGVLSGRKLSVDSLSIAQRAVLTASGTARVTLGAEPGSPPSIDRASVQIASLEFPAAYTTFLQLPLAATDFAALRTAGRASGRIEIASGAPVRLDAAIERLDIEDPGSRLAMADLRGELHWTAGGESAPSFVSFQRGSAYGLEVGATRLDFESHGLDFQLLRETRIPVFDGAIVVHSLAAAALGRPQARLRFDATIEPIGMPQLCKVFGWPQMQGSLSGRVPELAYQNRELTFGGDVVAHVFDGTITGANIRLTDPLGPWPRLDADVAARNLDLGLVTRTFPIGSITGRLDADVTGLELFAWSPVAFDARLYTAPGDRSRHLISQKAVTSLSNVGGGGGGVAAALQSGVLRFFDTFHYDKIGLRCILRNEVCLMSGIEPARNGFYIVKGRGLPRIDIIGNQGRVNWPQLVAQIESAMHSGNVVVH